MFSVQVGPIIHKLLKTYERCVKHKQTQFMHLNLKNLSMKTKNVSNINRMEFHK